MSHNAKKHSFFKGSEPPKFVTAPAPIRNIKRLRMFKKKRAPAPMIRKDGSGSFLMVSKASVVFSGPALISDLCQIPAPTICKISPAPNGSNTWRMGLQRPKIVNPSGGVDGSGVIRIYDFKPWLSVIAV